MHGFDPWSVHVRVVVDNVALGQISPRVLRVFPRQYYSGNAPYKWSRNVLPECQRIRGYISAMNGYFEVYVVFN